jgi:hypothetical protein
VARDIGTDRTLDVLVNCKTYPAVSKKYVETVCTGGVARDGAFCRLYPIPFRLLDEGQQYDRWDVIRVKVYKDTKDKRPESWHIERGVPIEIVEHVGSDRQRWDWMQKSVHESTAAMESAGVTNGCVEIVPHELYWEPEEKKWSDSQLVLMKQTDMFYGEEQQRSLGERVPWQFKLRFTEKSTGKEFDQKVLAWSYYRGFTRQLHRLGDEQQALAAVREKVYQSILNPDRAVFAIFGTHSRYKHWMISGLYHVPRSIRDGTGILF